MESTCNQVILFDGIAKEALDFYVSIFPNGKLLEVIYAEDDKTRSTVSKGYISIHGSKFLCADKSTITEHGSAENTLVYLSCPSHNDLKQLFHALSIEGQINTPIKRNSKGVFSGQTRDKFGVLWKLSTAEDIPTPPETNVCFAHSPEVRPAYLDWGA